MLVIVYHQEDLPYSVMAVTGIFCHDSEAT